MNHKDKEAADGWLHAVTPGASAYVDSDTEQTARRWGRQGGRRNTWAWQIELAAVGVRRT